MGKVFMGQGYYDKAAEIYRYLLSQAPDRQDLADLLADAQKLHRQSLRADRDRLVALFAQWLDLAAGCDRLHHLQRLQQRLADGRQPS